MSADESIDAMLARVERSYARDPDFVFEADGSPLEKIAYRHVRHLWFAALGNVSATDKGGRRCSVISLALYDAVCMQWQEDGGAPPPELLRRVGSDLLPTATFKMLRKRFGAAQRYRHRERFQYMVQSRAEAEVLLRRVAADAAKRERDVAERERDVAERERAVAEKDAAATRKYEQARELKAETLLAKATPNLPSTGDKAKAPK